MEVIFDTLFVMAVVVIGFIEVVTGALVVLVGVGGIVVVGRDEAEEGANPIRLLPKSKTV